MTLERRTPLRRGDHPLKRKTALKKGGRLKPRKVDPERDRRDDEWRYALRTRSHGRCEARTPVCTGRAEHAHHTRGRVGEDRWDVTAGLDVCAACHHFIHHDGLTTAGPGGGALSYEQGWLRLRVS